MVTKNIKLYGQSHPLKLNVQGGDRFHFWIKPVKRAYTGRIWLDGRVYKLNTNSHVFNFRFNRFNRTILIRNKLLNLYFHKWKRKIYFPNLIKSKTKT